MGKDVKERVAKKRKNGDLEGDADDKEERKMKQSREEVQNDEEEIYFDTSLVPKERNSEGELIFEDHPEFKPNLTPEEVIQMGSFGGTYFRPIYSNVVNRSISPEEAMKGLPKKWFKGLDMSKQVTSNKYRTGVNKYKEKCGQGLPEWESSGWITPYDPYGWFQWYCRFYLGRRCNDDARQIQRGMGVMGEKGRWRRYLANKCIQSGKSLEKALEDHTISPKVRQLLQHWGYKITIDALRTAKRLCQI